MTSYPRGSEWRRWDLHVHSPLSILANEFPKRQGGEPDWEQYVTALESNPIAVYGITDYFTIDGYKHLKTLQEQGRLAGKRLLPNVEFRLDKLMSKGPGQASRRLNLHVIFSDEVLTGDIEDHFLHDLNFVYEQNPTDASKRRRLKPSNLKELGERLKEEDASFIQPAIQVGAMTAIVNLQDILDCLQQDDRFKDKYLIVLPAENWDQIEWGGQDHLVRKTLLQAAHMVMASNGKTVAWCLGMPPYMQEPSGFVKEFGTLKPCIHGSDAHKIEYIAHPCSKRSDAQHDCQLHRATCDLRNLWIKCDPSFEGLRQALYEPRERVRIQELDPTPTKSIYSLSRLQIPQVAINSELTVGATDIPLNASLVAVTGGKGSGKTALVDLVADAFLDREHSDDRNSFVRRIAGEREKLQFTLTFANAETFAKTVGTTDRFDAGKVAYIAQGELERYIDENSDLNQYVHRLIFDSDAIRNSLDAFEYESLASKGAGIQKALASKNRVIANLERATTKTITDEVSKNGKKVGADLEDIEKRITLLEAGLSQEKIDANKTAQQHVAQAKQRRDSLLKARDLVDSTLRAIDSELRSIGTTIDSLNRLIADLTLGDPLPVPSYPQSDRLNKIRESIESKVRATVLDIEKQEKDLKKHAEDMREHSTALSKRAELKSKHSALQQQWRDLTKQREQLAIERNNRTELMTTLLQTVASQRQQYGKVIATFVQTKESILSDLDFKVHVTVDKTELIEAMEALVDNRQIEVIGTEKTPSEFANLMARLEQLATGHDEAVADVVTEVDRLSSEMPSKLKKHIQPEAFYDAAYASYMAVHPIVLFKQTGLDRLSLGQKATVLMKIYLAEGDHPIIIDSHDDHLDNEYIMAELVGAIRHAKLYRQVIIASNNGNVVVNSDAEQVVIAQREDGVVSYLSGSLEDPEIREKALKVLEGGPDAFRKRQEKYRMSAR